MFCEGAHAESEERCAKVLMRMQTGSLAVEDSHIHSSKYHQEIASYEDRYCLSVSGGTHARGSCVVSGAHVCTLHIWLLLHGMCDSVPAEQST